MRARVVVLLLFTFLGAREAVGAVAGEARLVRFEPNRGQVDARWAYVARTPAGELLLGEREVRIGATTLALTGADPGARWEALEPLPGRSHYLLGGDPERFVLDVPTFAAVARRQAYPGIDVVYRVTGRRVALELLVAPGADPGAMALALEGEDGRLEAPTVDGTRTSFRSSAKGFRLDVPRGARTGPARIDIVFEPTSRETAGHAPRLGSDALGNLYVAGHADTEPSILFLTKLDPSGKEVVQTTYLDGLDAASPLSIAVAMSGEAVVAGSAGDETVVVWLDRDGRKILHRATLPGAARSVALDANGSVWLAGSDASGAFVASIDASGSSTLRIPFGGPGAEARDIALDHEGDAYVAGTTGADAFIATIDRRTATLASFHTWGGNGFDEASAVAIASTGEIVVAGTSAEGAEPFVARWDATATRLESSSIAAGGAGQVRDVALAIDRLDRAWVTGSRGAGDASDVFVSRVGDEGLDATLAGEALDLAGGILIDGNGDAVVAGLTRSLELPDTSRPESARGGEVFVARLPGGDVAPAGTCPGSRNFTGIDSNAWEDADNWSGGVLPTAADNVCIQGFNVVIGVGLQNAGTLRVEGGSLTIGAAQLTVAGASEINAPLTINGGTLTGAGNVTISGTFSWTSGTLSGSGITTTNGSTSLSGTLGKGLFAHRWDVNGPVTWTGTGSVTVSSAAIINNASTWDCQSDASIVWAVGTATAFNNAGTFKKSAGTGTTTVQAPFYNTGSVLIQTGLMNFNSGGSSTGSFSVAAGTTMEILGGTYHFDAGTTITGSGAFLLDVGTLDVNAAVTIPASMSFTMAGGILESTGTLTAQGPFNWTGGTMQHGGVTTCNGALNISGAAAKGIQFGRTLNANATTTFTGTGTLFASTIAVINNPGTWDCQSDATIQWGVGTAPVFNNTGTFKKSAGAGTTTVQMPFVNTGAVLIQTGTMNFNSGSSSTGSFDLGAGRTLQFGGSTFALDTGTTFTGSGTILLNAATLNVNGAITVPTTIAFDMTGGTLQSTGTLTAEGPFNWTGGTMQHGGTTTCNGLLTIGGAAAKGITLSRTLNANGGTTFTGTGTLGASSLAVINNTSTWDCQSDATIAWGVGTAPAFNNSGTFKKSAGTTTIVQMPFYNTGSTLVQTGTINSNSGGSSTGLFDIAAGATLLFNGGTYNLDAGTIFTGLGAVNLAATTWNVNASVESPVTITLNMTGGALNGTGTLTTRGLFNWTAGTMGSAGTTTCEGLVTISGTGSKGIGSRILNTNGTTTWSGAGANLGLSFAAVLNNNGTWEVLNDATIVHTVGSAPVFRNFGTFRKSVGVGTTTLQLPYTNSGTVDIQSGTINATNYTQTAGTTQLTGGAFTSAVNIRIQGGTLAGSGTVTGPVLVSGTGALSPGLSAGALALSGSYTQQAPTGAFKVELGGTVAGTQHDRASVTGAATLAGVLDVSLLGGYVPLPGDTFTIMSYASRTGTFTTVNLPSVGCIGWRLTYGATALVLTAAAVPEEISALTMTNKTTLAWNPSPIYAGTSYNVLRGDLDKLPVGPGADETCVAPGTTATTATDAATPAAGKGYWYLVRETVATCGAGTYGFAASGAERVSSACP